MNKLKFFHKLHGRIQSGRFITQAQSLKLQFQASSNPGVYITRHTQCITYTY